MSKVKATVHSESAQEVVKGQHGGREWYVQIRLTRKSTMRDRVTAPLLVKDAFTSISIKTQCLKQINDVTELNKCLGQKEGIGVCREVS